MTTVAICDDNALVREALAGVIDLYPDMDVVGISDSSSSLREVVTREHPDVVVIDIRLGTDSGLDVARDVSGLSPVTKVIMLTSFANDTFLVEAHDLGASAFLLKSGTPDELVEAVRSVASGDKLIAQADVDAARDRLKSSS